MPEHLDEQEGSARLMGQAVEQSVMTPEHRYYPHTLEQKLGYLVEECGEVLAAVGKTQRWGLCSRNPDLAPDSETNCQWILRELRDLEQAITLVRAALERDSVKKSHHPGRPSASLQPVSKERACHERVAGVKSTLS